MGKEYKISLKDTDESEYGQDQLCVLETEKSLEEFEKDYYEVRSQWYEEDHPDCLFDYLVEELAKRGYDLCKTEPEKIDLEVNF